MDLLRREKNFCNIYDKIYDKFMIKFMNLFIKRRVLNIFIGSYHLK